VDLITNKITPKLDIYSVGMCLIEMFTLEYPYYECTTPYQIFHKQMQGITPAGLSKIDNADFIAIIEKCLQPLEKRPSSKELMDDSFFAEERTSNFVTTSPSVEAQHQRANIAIHTNTIANNKQSSLKVYGGGNMNGLTTPKGEGEHPSDPQSIKCYYSGILPQQESTKLECVRLYFSELDSTSHLKKIILQDFNLRESDQIIIKYQDKDSDFVTITDHTSIHELKEHAISLHLYLRRPLSGKEVGIISLPEIKALSGISMQTRTTDTSKYSTAITAANAGNKTPSITAVPGNVLSSVSASNLSSTTQPTTTSSTAPLNSQPSTIPNQPTTNTVVTTTTPTNTTAINS